MGVATPQWWTPESPHSIDDVADAYAHYAVRILT